METSTILSDSKEEKQKTSETLTGYSENDHSLSFSEKKAFIKSISKEILLFIVDDDLLYLKALEKSISDKIPHIKIKIFSTGEACLQQIKLNPDVVILDYFLNSKFPYAWNGLTILKQIKKINPRTKVIVLSVQDSLDVAVQCVDNGSFDYISKTESAFVKINNVLMNIYEDMKVNKKGIKPYQLISIIVIILLLCYLWVKNM